MKLVIVTSVEAFQKDVLKLFKSADIQNFSSSDIDGYKNGSSLLMATSWFPSVKGGNESSLFFSFAEDDMIDKLLKLIKEFNSSVVTINSVREVVVSIGRHV